MSEVDVLLERYTTLASLAWTADLSGAERVWFVVYSPAQERRMLLRSTDFEAATRGAGHGWVQLDLSDSFAYWMAAHEFREEYFSEPEFADTILPEFAEHLARQVKAALGTAETDTVVALCGLSSLFGLASVSELVNAVRNSIRGRLLVFFPGEKEGSNYRFLDARDGWNYLSIAITANEVASP